MKLIFFALSSGGLLAQGFNYSEATSGDLSDDYLKPTVLVIGDGSNVLEGTLLGNTSDLDMFRLVVPAGLEITGIRVLSFSGGKDASYLLMMPGDQLSSPPSNSFSDAIGYTGISEGSVTSGGNILPVITLPGLTGLPPFFGVSTLQEGNYAGWLNETGAASNYILDFEAQAVPEPSAFTLLAIISSGMLFTRNRRRF
ncbi:MAG: PEP-CTERM sorting domain-containing protein [Roseibacillus sp.]